MEEKKLLKKKQQSKESGNLQNFATYCNRLGVHYSEIDLHEKALLEFQDEAQAYKKLKKPMDNARAHRMIGEMYMLLDDFEKALQHVNIYLKVAVAANDKIEEQRAYATIGRVYLLNGQSSSELSTNLKPLKLAEKAFIKSLLVCKELKETINKAELLDMQARLYLNLGVTKENMQEFDESVKYIERAISVCQSNDFYELLHKCYISIGMIFHTKQSEFSKGLRYFNLALDVAERLPNRIQKICETLISKAEVLIKMGDFQSAKQVLHRSYKLKSPDKNDCATTERLLKVVAALCYTEDSLITSDPFNYYSKKKLYEKMGDGCCKLQNYTKAIDYYLKMLENAELNNEQGQELLPIYVSLAQTYKDNEEFATALTYLWKEYELEKEIPKEAFGTLITIAEIYEILKKPYTVIEDIYQKARVEARKQHELKLEKLAIEKLINLQDKNGLSVQSEFLKKEAELSGIDLTKTTSEEDETESEEENTPDIGDDICLDDLSFSASDNEEEPTKVIQTMARPSRKRTGFTIKKNNKGETQLHRACISGSVTLVKRLIDSGHPVFIRDNAGWLPLHEACNNGYVEIVELLLENGGNSRINDKGGTKCDGITPLYDACANGHLEVIEKLLSYGANATVLTDFGETPLDALEKWRATADLDYDRNLFYDTLRDKIIKILGSAGIKTDSSTKLNLSNKLENDDEDGLISSTFDDEFEIPLTQPENEQSSSNEYSYLPQTSNKIAKQAQLEYKKVMTNIRGYNKNNLYSPVSDGSRRLSLSSDKSTKRSALLNATEVDEETWLDDDLGPSKKKQKFLDDPFHDKPEKKTKQKSPVKKTFPSSSSFSNLNNLLYDAESENSHDAFEILMDGENNANKRNISQHKSKSSQLSLKRSLTPSSSSVKSQSSLIDAGFSKTRSESPPLYELSHLRRNSLQYASADTTCNLSSYNMTQPKNSQVPCAIKVKIDDKLILVAVDSSKLNELNIHWLAEEAANRYYKINGVRPTLQLTTIDGAYFQDTDPISLTIDIQSNNNIISSNILEWKIPPLIERYKDVCEQFKFKYDDSLCKLFEQCHLTHSLNLSDQQLEPEHFHSISKALKFEKDLFILDLSGNHISNTGAQYLSLILPHLNHLNLLNLSSNFILADGLNSLAKIFLQNKHSLNNLHELHLSFNPFGNKGIKYLITFVNGLEKLKVLNISDCEITNLCDHDNLKLNNLLQFDISFNIDLNKKSTKKLLNHLNPSIIKTLNFSSTSTYSEFSTDLANFFNLNNFESNKILDELNLALCCINDNGVTQILESLTNYTEIKVLNLNQNKLTSVSFKSLLNSQIWIKTIFLYGCSELLNEFDESEIIYENQRFPETICISLSNDSSKHSTEISILKNFWDKCWGLQGKIDVNFSKVRLFVEK